MRNVYYWIHWSKDVFRKEIAVLHEVIAQRLLPTFASSEDEAETISDETWQRLNAVDDPNADPGMDAETAEQAGIRHYEAMANAKQGLLNLFAVAIHHLVEQQQLTVLRQELISRGEEITEKTLTFAQFVERLADANVRVESFVTWPQLRVLREVANAVKHADGRAAKWLRIHHPETFISPSERGKLQTLVPNPIRWPFQPLSGQDLYVSADDLEKYFGAAENFWREFEEALALKAQTII